MTVFFFLKDVQHVYFAKFMLTVSLNGNPIIKNIEIDNIYEENFNNVLNKNAIMTKRASLGIFAIRIVDNLIKLTAAQ